MGSPPPVDLPPPGPPGVDVDVGLADAPSATSLCGFKFPPTLLFKFGFNLPPLGFPPPIPIPKLSIAINCSLSNPLQVDAGLAWGAGRVPNVDPNPDDLEQSGVVS